jgi:hypothetical protein
VYRRIVGRLTLIAACLAGCGFHVNAGGSGGDDMGPLDAPADQLDDPVPLPPWGAPVQVALVGTGGDDDPTLTADMLEMYFNRASDIYVTTRATRSDPWATPTLVAEVSGISLETTPEVSGDGLSLYLARDSAGQGEEIWVSVRATRNAPWGTPQIVTTLNSPFHDASSAPTDDGLVMVLVSDRHLVGNYQLYSSTRATKAAAWSLPVRDPSIVTATAYDSDPFLPGDKLTIYFDSTRVDGGDLFMAHRTALAEPFGAPERITELDTAGIEQDPWVSPDQRHIFFSVGGATIWEASR